jgi:hypothetical protein
MFRQCVPELPLCHAKFPLSIIAELLVSFFRIYLCAQEASKRVRVMT